jgi:nitrate/nitrite transporter NarK
MYDEIASRDIVLTLLILFTSFFAWFLVMNIFTKIKRRRKRRAIEYGIKDFMRRVRG